MTYLIVSTALSWLLLHTSYRVFAAGLGGTIPLPRAGRTVLGLFLLVGLCYAPLLIEFIDIALMSLGSPVAVHTRPYLFATLVFAAALGTGLVFGHRLYRLRHEPTAPHQTIGLNTLALAGAVYLGLVGIDHVRFFAGHDAGVLNWLPVRGSSRPVNDVECDANFVLFRQLRPDLAEYRCPTSIALGRLSAAPFVPWPSYTQGESSQLALAIAQMHADAVPARRGPER